MLDEPTLAEDPRFETNSARVHNRPALLEHLAPVLGQRSTAHWVEALNGAGVPSGPILSVGQALDYRQSQARGIVVEQEHATLGAVRTVGAPLGFAATSYATRPPPALGEHTVEVLTEVLGYDDERVRSLLVSGAARAG